MRIRKYYASNPYDAFNQIRAELGPDAIILQSQKVKQGGLLGLLKRPVYEISAAVDATDDGGPIPSVATARENLGGSSIARPSDLSGLASRLEDLTTTVLQMQESINALNEKRRARLSPQLSRLRDLLLARGLDAQLAQDVIKQIAFELSRKGVQDWSIVSQAAVRQLEDRLATVDLFTIGRDGPAVVFVVGPTGVGKTTTIAKLAAAFSAGGVEAISLATTDTIRVGAIAQLQAYADILGPSLDVAYTPEDLHRCVATNRTADLILVDSPGCGPQSRATQRLREFTDVVDGAIVLLAISAATKDQDALKAVEEFDGISIRGLIITKLDEASSVGSIFNLVEHSGLPVAYISDGPNVPEDVKPANAREIAMNLVGAPI